MVVVTCGASDPLVSLEHLILTEDLSGVTGGYIIRRGSLKFDPVYKDDGVRRCLPALPSSSSSVSGAGSVSARSCRCRTRHANSA